jgi:diguanylate cyclase (GGDEF)-like protein
MTKSPISSSLLKKVQFLFAILMLGFAMFVYESIKENEFAALINYAGKVRGSIQRLAKYYFADKDAQIPLIEKEINFYFRYLEDYADSLKIPLLDKDKEFKPVKVKKCFSQLTELIKKPKTPQNREKVFEISETCWLKSNELTDFYQEKAERNFLIINLFYFFSFFTALLIIILLIRSIVYEISQKLERRANFDPLTGALNRSAFMEIYKHLSKSYLSYPMGLIIFDIDNFKYINDTFGHVIGDEVLKKVAQTVRKLLRRSDLFARWGGEEFVVLLPYTDLEGAKKVTEKLRRAIKNLKFSDSRLKVTASFGVTEIKEGEDFFKAFERADKALYKAKKNGKNRVEVG